MGFGKTLLQSTYHALRKVSILAAKEIASGTAPAPVWIYEITKDNETGELPVAYASRSFSQYAKLMRPSLGDKQNDLAMVHLSTTSGRPDLNAATDNVLDMYGGHIVLAVARQQGEQLTLLPDAHMSKSFFPKKPFYEEPKDAEIVDDDGKLWILKNEDYQRDARFDNNKGNRIDRFLTGYMDSEEAAKFGSREFVLVFPLRVLGLTVEEILHNIENYKNDPKSGAVYDRMHDACTQAAVACMGITKLTRGLTTQEAVMQIASLLENKHPDLFDNFLDETWRLGLSSKPHEVYNDRKHRANAEVAYTTIRPANRG